jgi:predicted TIM-barrel fold metal-dependent hydrolase
MIIDAHCHLGRTPQFEQPDVSVVTMLRVMDRLGIERTIASPLSLLSGPDESAWQEALAAHRDSGGRILLYTVFDPTRPGSLEFAERTLGEPGVVGVKIHPAFHLCPASDDRYRAIWQLAARQGVPILTHSWCVSDYNPTQRFAQPHLFGRYVDEFPDVPLILGHAGGRYEGHLAAAALARQHPNVYVDLSGDCYSLGLVEYLVREAGAPRVLYGSDLTWIDPRTQLAMVLDAPISPADKASVLRDNALRLFRLPEKED